MGYATDHRASVISALSSLRLMEFDWDGAGGLPLRADVADTAYDVYTVATGILQSDTLGRLSHPSVSMNSNGTIEVAYSEPDTSRQLFLTFECLGVITYIKVFEDEQTSIEGTVRLDMDEPMTGYTSEIRELYEWLSSE